MDKSGFSEPTTDDVDDDKNGFSEPTTDDVDDDKNGFSEPTTDDVDARKREHFRARLRYCYNNYCLDSLWDEFDYDDNPEMYTDELRMHNQARLARKLKEVYAMRLLGESSRIADGSGKVLGSEDVSAYGSGKDLGSKDVSNNAADKWPSEKLKMGKNMIVVLAGVRLVSPSVGGQGGKPIIGTLQGHVKGLIFEASSSSFHNHFLYEDLKDSFFRVADDSMPPLLHFHFKKYIRVGTEMTKHIQFHLVMHEVQRKVRKRNKDLKSFVEGVQDKWHKMGIPPEPFEGLLKKYEFSGIGPSQKTTAFALTYFSLVGLVEEPFSVVTLSDIEIVNLAKLEGGIDMTIIFQDLNNVLEIKSIPDASLIGILSILDQAGIKYYVNQEKWDWKAEVKRIANDLQDFIERGGWEVLEDRETKKLYSLEPDFYP